MIKPVYSQRARENPYWNEVLETMPREQLDALHLKRLRALIKHAYENIPMYREIYDEAGVRPEEIQTLDDYVEKLPTVDKQDVLKYQTQGKSTVPGSEQYISFLYQTSGTTGKPLLEPGHFPDLINMWTYQWWAHGIRPGDVFYFVFPFGTFMAFWSAYFDALLLGAEVISGGGVDTKTRIRQIHQFRPTVLISTPTYALRLAEVAKETGVDTRATSIRIISTAGEAGSMIPAIRRALEEAWNAKAIDLYGISELWGSTSWECPAHPDRMHLGESTAYGIVVDENGRLVPDGGRGEFVLTNYEATIQPLIKYRTHDVVEWHKEPCDCGRSWLWLRGGVLARTDQMVTVKGANVYPSAIQALLGEVKGLSERMEIHIDGDEGVSAKVMVKVEPSPDIGEKSYPALKSEAEAVLRANIGVTIPVEVVPPQSLPRYELKAKLVFDHRPKGVG
ncbi:MAG: phenylacetate--CoA ligase family protein [Candidatus Binatia bacterium]